MGWTFGSLIIAAVWMCSACSVLIYTRFQNPYALPQMRNLFELHLQERKNVNTTVFELQDANVPQVGTILA